MMENTEEDIKIMKYAKGYAWLLREREREREREKGKKFIEKVKPHPGLWGPKMNEWMNEWKVLHLFTHNLLTSPLPLSKHIYNLIGLLDFPMRASIYQPTGDLMWEESCEWWTNQNRRGIYSDIKLSFFVVLWLELTLQNKIYQTLFWWWVGTDSIHWSKIPSSPRIEVAFTSLVCVQNTNNSVNRATKRCNLFLWIWNKTS